ncbi:MAG: DNA topoisomerase 3 [Bacillota bacterium]
MKTLIIAEKPSVAREIAHVLGTFGKKDGYLENGNYVVSWAFGHIVTLAEPHAYQPEFEKWSFNTLPIIPSSFKLSITEKKQFSILKKLLKRDDISTVVNACDAGREGELIFRWIYRASKSKLPIKRLWLSETTPAAIEKALQNIKPGSQYDNLYFAAEARAKSDWLIGINATRAFTLKHGELLSIGRVQTPTLALIVQREREIRDFVPERYWQVAAAFKTINGERYTGMGMQDGSIVRFKDEVTAKMYSEKVKKDGIIARVSYNEKTEQPPMLFNLNDLQKEANRLFGMTAARALDIAQSLYERKLITYPRTVSRHLSESMVNTLDKRIAAALAAISFCSFPESYSKPGKRYIDDSKITDHHAIIPTEIHLSGRLLPEQSKIYDLICRRYLSIFLQPAIYRVMEVTTNAGVCFFSKGSTIINPGWRLVYKLVDDGEEEVNEAGLPVLREGEAVAVVDTELLKKETRPPARYNDATLLSVMENAGRLVDDKELSETLKRSGGIGTPATRAAIIERLIKVGYVQRVNKSLVPAPKGETLIDLVPDVLKNVETTAEWESDLLKIEQGESKAEDWIKGIIKLTMDIVVTVKGELQLQNSDKSKTEKIIGKHQLQEDNVIEKPTLKQSQESLMIDKTSAIGSPKITTKMSSNESKAAAAVSGAVRSIFRSKERTPRVERTEGILDGILEKTINFFKTN